MKVHRPLEIPHVSIDMSIERIDPGPRARRGSKGWILTLLSYLIVVAVLTLTPAPWAEIRGEQFSFGVLNPEAWGSGQTWATGAPQEFVLNLLMFFPLGLLLAHWRTAEAAAAAALLTFGIEVAQIWIVGRISDPRDLIANVAGALLGVLIAALIRKTRRRVKAPHVSRG